MYGSAVFGVEIASLARREGKPVPTIVTACLREVEKRGESNLDYVSFTNGRNCH